MPITLYCLGLRRPGNWGEGIEIRKKKRKEKKIKKKKEKNFGYPLT